jgi:hypothetical protein
MTAETTSAASDAAEDELLWPEEVAALIGTGVNAETVKQYLKQARRHAREHTRTDYEIPEPVPDPESADPSGRWRRTVPGGRYGTVVVNSNRWRKSEILAWQERVRNRPPAPRARTAATGQFTGKP